MLIKDPPESATAEIRLGAIRGLVPWLTAMSVRGDPYAKLRFSMGDRVPERMAAPTPSMIFSGFHPVGCVSDLPARA